MHIGYKVVGDMKFLVIIIGSSLVAVFLVIQDGGASIYPRTG
jgi:hypothetical protein